MSRWDAIGWLQMTFSGFCNGEWEREYGINIATTGNPGWHVEINLSYTPFEDVSFDSEKIVRSEDDWIILGAQDGSIFGSGGPSNLYEILERIASKLAIEH
jgi:hypothetical protein